MINEFIDYCKRHKYQFDEISDYNYRVYVKNEDYYVLLMRLSDKCGRFYFSFDIDNKANTDLFKDNVLDKYNFDILNIDGQQRIVLGVNFRPVFGKGDDSVYDTELSLGFKLIKRLRKMMNRRVKMTKSEVN